MLIWSILEIIKMRLQEQYLYECQNRIKYVEYLFDHTTKSSCTVINMVDFDIKSRFGQVDIVFLLQ